jgi:hypothetical protein
MASATPAAINTIATAHLSERFFRPWIGTGALAELIGRFRRLDTRFRHWNDSIAVR